MQVSSASCELGNHFKVILDGKEVKVEGERGIGLVVVEKGTRRVTFARMFDTYLDPNESSKLNSILFQVKPGNLIIMGIKDEGSRSLSVDLINTISMLGSKLIHQLGYRDSWAFVVRKGKPESAREVKDSHQAVELTLCRKPHIRHILLSSASFDVGNSFTLAINDHSDPIISYKGDKERGVVMIIIDRQGKVVYNQIFDTYSSTSASDQLEKAISDQISQHAGCLLILGVKDEASRSLTPSLRNRIALLGSHQINQLEYRDSWCFITRIGKPQSACEERQPHSSKSAASLSWLPKPLRSSIPPPRYSIHYHPPNPTHPPPIHLSSSLPSSLPPQVHQIHQIHQMQQSHPLGGGNEGGDPQRNIEHSPDDLYHHPHPSHPPPHEGNQPQGNQPQVIVDYPVQSVHHTQSATGAGVDVGMNVRNNQARRRDTLS